jgi:hypothetical protein
VIDSLRIAMVPIIGVGSAVMYLRFPAIAMLAIRAVMFLVAILVVVLVITGLSVTATHSVLGHVFVIVLWVLTPVGVGVTLAEAWRSRRWSRLGHIVALVLLSGAGFLASITGYLPRAPEASAPQQLRFVVLHEVGFPLLTVMLVAIWVFLSRGYAQKGVYHATANRSRSQ